MFLSFSVVFIVFVSVGACCSCLVILRSHPPHILFRHFPAISPNVIKYHAIITDLCEYSRSLMLNLLVFHSTLPVAYLTSPHTLIQTYAIRHQRHNHTDIAMTSITPCSMPDDYDDGCFPSWFSVYLSSFGRYLSSAFCLLSSTVCLLPSAFCLLPSAFRLSSIVFSRPSFVFSSFVSRLPNRLFIFHMLSFVSRIPSFVFFRLQSPIFRLLSVIFSHPSFVFSSTILCLSAVVFSHPSFIFSHPSSSYILYPPSSVSIDSVSEENNN